MSVAFADPLPFRVPGRGRVYHSITDTIGDTPLVRLTRLPELEGVKARTLLAARSAEGACNRAYYAMFDAAHAALFALQAEGLQAPVKTHNGLIAKFGEHLVRPGLLPAALGEALNAVQRLRLLAITAGSLFRWIKPPALLNGPKSSWRPCRAYLA